MATKHRVETLAAGILFAVVLTAVTSAQAPVAPPQAPPAPVATGQAPVIPSAQAPAQPSSRGGTNEGIKVHGHWIIDVRNPDGLLASHNEFDNAFVGSVSLVDMFRHVDAFYSMAIYLAGSSCDAGGPSPCYIVEDAFKGPLLSARGVGSVFPNLVLTTITGPSAVALGMAGSATMTFAGSIANVSTLWGSCVAGPCANYYYFTYHDLTTPIAVLAGQTVQVIVTLSFS